jgi:hypothetical protein
MPKCDGNSLDPDLSDALHAALGSIRYAKSLDYRLREKQPVRQTAKAHR